MSVLSQVRQLPLPWARGAQFKNGVALSPYPPVCIYTGYR